MRYIKIEQDIANLPICCSKDDSRPVLNYVFLDSKNKCFIATDGHILNCIPHHSIEFDMLIKWKPFKIQNKKSAYIDLQKEKILLVKGFSGDIDTNQDLPYEKAINCQFGNLEENPYPNYNQAIPKDREHVYKIGIDAKQLHDLAKTVSPNNETLELHFEQTGRSCIIVKSISPNTRNHKALIMPLRIERSGLIKENIVEKQIA